MIKTNKDQSLDRHGFSNMETVFDNSFTLIQKIEYDDRLYALKTYKEVNDNSNLREKINREYEINLRLYPSLATIIPDSASTILLTPFATGITLSSFIKNWIYDSTEFLTISIGIANEIARIHKQNILHLDINPSNIIYNPSNDEVKIIDFGSSNFYRQTNVYLGNPERVECDLHYISPEQTGRINRKIDFTSDLYSCGAVLYELATGNKMYETSEPMELVHNHIAKIPKDPGSVNSNIPKKIAEIILKLLAKNIETRYQTASGLSYDLNRCKEYLEEKKDLDDIQLASNDICDKFKISEKTYGRNEEIKMLESAFESACSGNKEIVLVSGLSGTGKSNLVASIHKKLTGNNAIFIQGKFDQISRNIPYNAWVEAFNNFIELIITESEQRLSDWKDIIQENIGQNLPYLAQIISNLSWIFENIVNEPLTFSAETRNRLLYALKTFIQSIATEDHPLVIFIDDWQWADKASIDFLNKTISDDSFKFIQIIAAYRNNEITVGHSFTASLDLLSKYENCSKINLKNLRKEDTLQLLKDTFCTYTDRIVDLNNLIYNRTEGNPLYYVQFLEALKQEDLIRFNHHYLKWEWEINSIQKTIMSDNIVELMVKKIERFNHLEQKLLQVASCVGGVFDMGIISEVCGIPKSQIKSHLKRALSEGFIISNYNPNVVQKRKHQNRNEYRFAHDRIQQGVYAMLLENEIKLYHYQLGKIFIDHYSDEEIAQNIFPISEQLNKGLLLIQDTDLLLKLSSLNRRAGEKAKILADFESALKYTNYGIEVSELSGLGEKDESLIGLLLQRYELAFFLKLDDKISKWENTITEKKLSSLEYAKFIRIKVSGLISQGEFYRALHTGLSFMAENGIKVKKNPSNIDIILSSIRTSFKYKKNKIKDLIDLPIITDPIILELSEIIQGANGAAYFSNQKLWAHITIETTRYYLGKGLCPLAALTFIAYGATLIMINKDSKSGKAFGDLSMTIFKRLNTTDHLNKSLFVYHSQFSWWNEPIQVSIDGIEEALSLSLSSGDFVFVGHCCNVLSGYCTTLGTDINIILNTLGRYLKLVKSVSDLTNINVVRTYNNLIKSLALPNYKDEKLEDIEIKEKDEPLGEVKMGRHAFYSSRYKLNYLLKQYDQMEYNVRKYEELNFTSFGTYITIHGDFYLALAHGIIYPNSDRKEQKRMKESIKNTIKELERLSKITPINFENKYEILRAVFYKIQGKIESAISTFEKAVELSLRDNFPVEASIAWEECANLYFREGKHTIGNAYLERSYRIYNKWGAKAITTRMTQEYPWLKDGLGMRLSSATGSSSGRVLANIDMETIIRSSEVLVGETDFQKLLRKLVLIAIQNAGAQRGYLLLRRDGKLKINAYGDVDQTTKIFANQDVGSFNDISQKVINYVSKTKRILILADAINDLKFGDDEYFQRQNTKSVFSFPIMNKGIFVGLFYLENNHTLNAFTEEGVELLKLLTGQIAISIENALLFEQMEEKVRERTIEIEKEKDISDNLLLNILPRSTANELKISGKAEPRFYKEASVLFLDFKNFSGASKKLDFKQVINQLDAYFKAFDAIIDKYHVEKIKTIGDAYMCACGLPIEREDHALMMCRAAIEMQKIVSDFKNERASEGKSYFEARIGIHSGPVVAGVVGSKKFAYDIWGDTVNVASRLESACFVGEIAISEQTYQLVKGELTCEPKGKVELKHMGALEMYFLHCN